MRYRITGVRADDPSRAWRGGVIALVMVVAALLFASCGAQEGQGGGGDGAQGNNTQAGQETGQTRPAERVTTAEVTNDPSAFYGEWVTVNGEVIEAVQPGAVRIEGDEGGELLVVGIQQLSQIAEGTVKEVNEGDRIQATGEVRQFRIEEVQSELDYGIDNEYFGNFEGDPALLASSVRVIS